jgi:hypothetical protein
MQERLAEERASRSAASEVSTPIAPPVATSTAAPVVARCDEAPAVIIDMINAGFTDGQYLEDVQAVNGPKASTYIAGNVMSADGERDSSHEAWVYSDGKVYALTKNARRDSLFTDGTDLFPEFFSDEYVTLDNCITNVTRAKNGQPPIPMR